MRITEIFKDTRRFLLGHLFIPQEVVLTIFILNYEFQTSCWDERDKFRISAKFQRKRAHSLLSLFFIQPLLLFQNILNSVSGFTHVNEA